MPPTRSTILHIITVYDLGEEGDDCYIIIELVEGESLRALIEGGTFPGGQADRYRAPIADGLAAAHSAGITCRNLKPENIILTREGRVKIRLRARQAVRSVPDEATVTQTSAPIRARCWGRWRT